MHTISLKTDDNFYELVNSMTKTLKTTKSELIRKAVLNYKDSLEKEELKKQIQKASYLVREESLKISQEFQDTSKDGLDNV